MSRMDWQALEEEFDLVMARYGIIVPAERRAGALAGFLELRRMATLLRNARDAFSEPANTFSVSEVLRGE